MILKNFSKICKNSGTFHKLCLKFHDFFIIFPKQKSNSMIFGNPVFSYCKNVQLKQKYERALQNLEIFKVENVFISVYK